MKHKVAGRLQKSSGPSVWLEFSRLAELVEGINLGQGFPDWDPPEFVVEASIKSSKSKGIHRYARSSGHKNLVEEITRSYEERLKHKINPLADVLVTVGASEALYLALMTYVNPGDEVLVIEPAFDLYYGAINMAGGVAKGVSLKPGQDGFQLDPSDLDKQMSPKTKVLMLNTPHNPTGKVFTRDEYLEIAKVLKKYPNCIVVSDEVYEHLVYDDMEHIPFANIPGMGDRTISVYSAGKTFSITGWKIGWIIGNSDLVRPLQGCQQWVVFSVATHLQEAIAMCLQAAKEPYQGESSYYSWLREEYTQKRSILFEGLKHSGFKPILPQGSFFILTEYEHLKPEWDHFPDTENSMLEQGKIYINPATRSYKDYNFARNLAFNNSVVSIPVSAFMGYCAESSPDAQRYVRFAFCKSDALLRHACKKMIFS
ncbi:MAG: aminotransferase class I/II-fold pyridoxal phosphate-dependent enzyme [Oligoflexales bacterium]|nr:aminotransferase class I/II-fold pyridoxal phosphate-dependent enzyme [Oligoflexales bacterium]